MDHRRRELTNYSLFMSLPWMNRLDFFFFLFFKLFPKHLCCFSQHASNSCRDRKLRAEHTVGSIHAENQSVSYSKCPVKPSMHLKQQLCLVSVLQNVSPLSRFELLLIR